MWTIIAQAAPRNGWVAFWDFLKMLIPPCAFAGGTVLAYYLGLKRESILRDRVKKAELPALLQGYMAEYQLLIISDLTTWVMATYWNRLATHWGESRDQNAARELEFARDRSSFFESQRATCVMATIKSAKDLLASLGEMRALYRVDKSVVDAIDAACKAMNDFEGTDFLGKVGMVQEADGMDLGKWNCWKDKAHEATRGFVKERLTGPFDALVKKVRTAG